MKNVLVFAAGVTLGGCLTVGAVNAWPTTRMAPVLFTENDLSFGWAENHRMALCDRDMNAYTPSGSGVAYMAEFRGEVLTTLRCISAMAQRDP